ncbi:MAG: M1 family aminopeptidase [Elusimicrobiota bacterium]
MTFRLLAALLLAGPALAAERFPENVRRFRPDRQIDILHTKVEIVPDLAEQSYKASVTHSFKVLAASLSQLSLDAALLKALKVTDGAGRVLSFRQKDEKLLIDWPKPPMEGDDAAVRVEYESTQPQLGLHFFKLDPKIPGQPDQLWSKGETERTRFWIPLYDYPNERASSEMIVTVPEGFSALSNGRLVSTEAVAGGRVVYHWLQERAHAPYLITLTVGRYSRVALEGGPVPMAVWAPPGREEDARRTFARTPEMVRFFEGLIGQSYPWAKFDQALLYGFRWGGMEDVSAVMLNERYLVDARAALDSDSEGVMSHELAHQWFGDLLTCKDWSQMWLNEGFATFLSNRWLKQSKGADEAALELEDDARWYFGEGYRRALVSDRYDHSDNMFDAHSYAKGAWFLQMLKADAGEEDFWKALKLYTAQNLDGVVESDDLRRAFEETTGRAYAEFFRQWAQTPGHPRLTLEASWDAPRKRLELKTRQTQAEPFRFKLPLELRGPGSRTVVLDLDAPEQTFSWELPERPAFLSVDPAQSVLVDLTLEAPQDWLAAALKQDSVPGRLRAARALARRPTPANLERLRRCLKEDPFWGVAAACAGELGALGGPQALAALKEGLALPHPKTRRAAAAALGGFTLSQEAASALEPLARHDPSVFVEAEALQALGALRRPQAGALLEAKLSEDSYNDLVRRAALSGLGRLKDPLRLPLLRQWAQPGKPVYARLAALSALASAGAGRAETTDLLIEALGEEDRLIRGAAASALAALGDPRGIEPLAALKVREHDPRLRIRGWEPSLENLQGRRRVKLPELSRRADALSERAQDLDFRIPR